MKRKLLALGLVFIWVLSGCTLLGGQQVDGTITLVDNFDRQVELPGPAQKIVSLAPETTEILFALGVGERIVGATDFCDHPPQARDIPRVGSFGEPNLEIIVSLEPDLVIAASLHKEVVEKLEEIGIAVLALNPVTFADIYANIVLLAEAVGLQDAGAQLVADMEQQLDQVAGLLADVEERPVVYYEVWYPGPMTAGKGTLIDEMITLAGGQNVAHDTERYPTLQEEVLIERNPQFILYGHFADPKDFAQRQGWSAIDAVAKGQVHYVDPDIVNRAGPRVVEAVQIIARILHPDKFE